MISLFWIFLFNCVWRAVNMDDTIDRIVEASGLPLSIVIVGVGSADFTNMKVSILCKYRVIRLCLINTDIGCWWCTIAGSLRTNDVQRYCSICPFPRFQKSAFGGSCKRNPCGNSYTGILIIYYNIANNPQFSYYNTWLTKRLCLIAYVVICDETLLTLLFSH